MKKMYAMLVVSLVVFSSFGQTKGDLRGGISVALGTNSGINQNTGFAELGLGLNLGLEYFLSELVSVAPNYTVFGKTSFGSSKLGFNYLNFDLRYYINEGDFRFYALGGIHTMFSRRQMFGFTESFNQQGLNVGLGLNIPLGDAFYGNAQLKRQEPFQTEFRRDGQWAISFGIVYAFN